ncbi:MAG TPA: glycosyltransferase family 2 protein [Geothrix sp.]|uniref:glycosyltransferase family 2 protein n=1 Tax=Geothrix mesophila TaxID=2922723 RepID=UPI002435389D|nr:glycosyltransferase family 2 protein [Geothrix sp. SG198]HJV39910.1 glycosyltransferase family 2 protein [Geothrix sp.]
MPWIDLAAWIAATLLLAGLALLRRHWTRLPALAPDPALPADPPSVCLCIPVRNEALELPAAIDSWLAQDYPALRIVVVDDGSTDGSPEILQARAQARPDRLRVVRNDRLPPGWLGKNHALDLAVRQPEAQGAAWLLFADGDVQASPTLLRRAVAFALAQPTDILALIPGVDAVGPAERVVLPLAASAFQLLVPPHQVPNPRHPAFCGVGGFTLVRREAYEAAGGHAAAPLEAIDDMMLARRMKQAGFVNRVARGGPDLHLRMYHGLGELVRAMRKNAAALPAWGLLPLLLPPVALVMLAPLWLPFTGHPGLALLLWLLVPALAGDVQQRMTGRPMDLLWALWPLDALVFAAGTAWAFADRLRGVNHWRGRDVKLR